MNLSPGEDDDDQGDDDKWSMHRFICPDHDSDAISDQDEVDGLDDEMMEEAWELGFGVELGPFRSFRFFELPP